MAMRADRIQRSLLRIQTHRDVALIHCNSSSTLQSTAVHVHARHIRDKTFDNILQHVPCER